jgi:hypothetical protein
MLVAKTGRRTEAIAKAIKSLEDRGLIRRTLELSTEALQEPDKGGDFHRAKSEEYIPIQKIIKRQRRAAELSTMALKAPVQNRRLKGQSRNIR